jgi:hypothetical protein
MPETSVFNEASYENAIISLLESIGYTHLYGQAVLWSITLESP